MNTTDPRAAFAEEPAVSFADASVAVLGCGSVGGLAAWACASAGVRTLTLADRDRLEPANSRRHVCGVADRGRPKAEAVADFLRQRGGAWSLTTANGCFLADPDAVDQALSRCEIVLVLVDAEGPRHLADALARERHRPAVYAGVYGGGWGAEAVFSDAAEDTPCYACAARVLGHGGVETEAPAGPAYALPAAAPGGGWVEANLTSILPCAALAARVALAWLARARGFDRPWRELTAGGATAWRLALRHVPAWGIGSWALQPVTVSRLPGCPVCGAGRRAASALDDLFAEGRP
jgi:molybdopterin/thiamine biosynthesis adenylyltransferase